MAKQVWTPERRQRQAEICRQVKPWLKSTGPKTALGKYDSARRGAGRPKTRRA